MTFKTALLATAATCSLAACGGMQMTGMDDGPSPAGTADAESACMTAVNANTTSGSSSVVSSESSGAGSVVVLRSSDGTNWRCLASNGGVVE